MESPNLENFVKSPDKDRAELRAKKQYCSIFTEA